MSVSSTRWRKVETGLYVSPDGLFTAWQPDVGCPWRLYENLPHYQRSLIASHRTLADCREHAERARLSL